MILRARDFGNANGVFPTPLHIFTTFAILSAVVRPGIAPSSIWIEAMRGWETFDAPPVADDIFFTGSLIHCRTTTGCMPTRRDRHNILRFRENYASQSVNQFFFSNLPTVLPSANAPSR